MTSNTQVREEKEAGTSWYCACGLQASVETLIIRCAERNARALNGSIVCLWCVWWINKQKDDARCRQSLCLMALFHPLTPSTWIYVQEHLWPMASKLSEPSQWRCLCSCVALENSALEWPINPMMSLSFSLNSSLNIIHMQFCTWVYFSSLLSKPIFKRKSLMVKKIMVFCDEEKTGENRGKRNRGAM